MSLEQALAEMAAAVKENTAVLRDLSHAITLLGEERLGSAPTQGSTDETPATANAPGKRAPRKSKSNGTEVPSGMFDQSAPTASNEATTPQSQGAVQSATVVPIASSSSASSANAPNASDAGTPSDEEVYRKKFNDDFLALSELNANGVNGMQFVKNVLAKHNVKRAGELPFNLLPGLHEIIKAETKKAEGGGAASLI